MTVKFPLSRLSPRRNILFRHGTPTALAAREEVRGRTRFSSPRTWACCHMSRILLCLLPSPVMTYRTSAYSTGHRTARSTGLTVCSSRRCGLSSSTTRRAHPVCPIARLLSWMCIVARTGSSAHHHRISRWTWSVLSPLTF